MNLPASVATGGCPVTSLSDTFKLSNEELEGILKYARAESPVTHLPDIGYWAISGYDDIKTILSDKEKFSSEITLEPLKPYSEEVGELLGVTRERVRQVQLTALARLREISEREGIMEAPFME